MDGSASCLLSLRVARTRDKQDAKEDLRFSTSVVNKVLTDLEPMLSTVQSDSDALELGRSVFDLKLRSVMCVPLLARDTAVGEKSDPPTGVLYVDKVSDPTKLAFVEEYARYHT